MNRHFQVERVYSYIPRLLFCCCLFLYACTKEISSELFFERTTQKSFADVVQDIEFAITENNFRITTRLHIGEAIRERGNNTFPENEIVLFCNLSLAEDMLKIEPRYIRYCPYKITIAESDNEIIIGTRLLPIKNGNVQMDKFAKEVNKTLSSIIDYAAADDFFMLDKM